MKDKKYAFHFKDGGSISGSSLYELTKELALYSIIDRELNNSIIFIIKGTFSYIYNGKIYREEIGMLPFNPKSYDSYSNAAIFLSQLSGDELNQSILMLNFISDMDYEMVGSAGLVFNNFVFKFVDVASSHIDYKKIELYLLHESGIIFSRIGIYRIEAIHSFMRYGVLDDYKLTVGKSSFVPLTLCCIESIILHHCHTIGSKDLMVQKFSSDSEPLVDNTPTPLDLDVTEHSISLMGECWENGSGDLNEWIKTTIKEKLT